MHLFEENIKNLGLNIPDLPNALANYVPYKIVDKTMYISGQAPVKNGELIYNFPSVQQIQAYATKELTKLPNCYKTLSEEGKDRNGGEYPVEISPQLAALQKKVIKEKTTP